MSEEFIFQLRLRKYAWIPALMIGSAYVVISGFTDSPGRHPLAVLPWWLFFAALTLVIVRLPIRVKLSLQGIAVCRLLGSTTWTWDEVESMTIRAAPMPGRGRSSTTREEVIFEFSPTGSFLLDAAFLVPGGGSSATICESLCQEAGRPVRHIDATEYQRNRIHLFELSMFGVEPGAGRTLFIFGIVLLLLTPLLTFIPGTGQGHYIWTASFAGAAVVGGVVLWFASRSYWRRQNHEKSDDEDPQRP